THAAPLIRLEGRVHVAPAARRPARMLGYWPGRLEHARCHDRGRTRLVPALPPSAGRCRRHPPETPAAGILTGDLTFRGGGASSGHGYQAAVREGRDGARRYRAARLPCAAWPP